MSLITKKLDPEAPVYSPLSSEKMAPPTEERLAGHPPDPADRRSFPEFNSVNNSGNKNSPPQSPKFEKGRQGWNKNYVTTKTMVPEEEKKSKENKQFRPRSSPPPPLPPRNKRSPPAPSVSTGKYTGIRRM